VVAGVVLVVMRHGLSGDGFHHLPADPRRIEPHQQTRGEGFTRKTIFFTSEGVMCEAWLYLPTSSPKGKPPVVVMAHGLAAQKEFGLDKYAERFARAGAGVFVFDYRGFGGSDGEPRNLVHPGNHLADWRAAIQHIYSSSELAPLLDVENIALWGTSFSGGHVVVTAADDRVNKTRIKAVISQVPYLDPFSTLTGMDHWNSLKQVGLSIWDMLASFIGLPPVYMQLVGHPNETAIMTTPESWSGYMSLVPERPASGWQNKVPARIALLFLTYRPISYVGQVEAPILFVAAEKDTLCPLSTIERAAKTAKKAKLLKDDLGHFEYYNGANFEKSVKEHVNFLSQHLF